MPEGRPKANKSHLTASSTYFFKRKDNSFIMVDARSAWQIYSGHNQVFGGTSEPWTYIGRTNGQKYIEAVKKAHLILESQGTEAYNEALKKAEKDEYNLAKKDKTPPPNFASIDRNSMPINLQHYGN